MNEINPDTMAPVGGASPTPASPLAPVGGMAPLSNPAPPVASTPPAPIASTPPVSSYPAATPAAPSRFNTPPTPSRFDTPPASPSRFNAPMPTPTLAPARSSDYTSAGDDDSLPGGRLFGAVAAGFGVGVVYSAIWLWILFTFNFNIAILAIGVGYAIGFVMTSIAPGGHTAIKVSAIILSVLFALVGVLPNLMSHNGGGIIFSILCVMVAARAAMRATG